MIGLVKIAIERIVKINTIFLKCIYDISLFDLILV